MVILLFTLLVLPWVECGLQQLGDSFQLRCHVDEENIGINTGVSSAAGRVCEESGWRANKSATIKGTSCVFTFRKLKQGWRGVFIK
jgi:hypothetical protein